MSSSEYEIWADGKGLKLSHKDETTGQKTEFFLKWDQVATIYSETVNGKTENIFYE